MFICQAVERNHFFSPQINTQDKDGVQQRKKDCHRLMFLRLSVILLSVIQPNKFTASKVIPSSLQCQVRSTLRIIERVFGMSVFKLLPTNLHSLKGLCSVRNNKMTTNNEYF
jgi:hypothetical protein